MTTTTTTQKHESMPKSMKLAIVWPYTYSIWILIFWLKEWYWIVLSCILLGIHVLGTQYHILKVMYREDRQEDPTIPPFRIYRKDLLKDFIYSFCHMSKLEKILFYGTIVFLPLFILLIVNLPETIVSGLVLGGMSLGYVIGYFILTKRIYQQWEQEDTPVET